MVRHLRIAEVAPPLVPVPPSGYGGTERIVGELVRALHDRGHDVTTFASGDSTVPGRLVPTVFSEDGRAALVVVPLSGDLDDAALQSTVDGIRTEVRSIDYVVVFEMIDGRLTAESQPVRLTDLGVEPAVLRGQDGSTTTTLAFSDDTRLWGWAGLGLAAAALTLIALWAVPDRRRQAA